MLSQLIWWSSIALEILVLVRGFQTKLASRYPVFYGYIIFVLVFEDLASYPIKRWDPVFYKYSYWATEFLGVLIGCGVVFEIYRIGLLRYPGTAKMARNALGLVFVLALTKALVAASNDSRWWMEASTLQIERILRTVQALAIVALAGVFLLYSIPIRKDLRGILLGYGLFVGVLALCLIFVPEQGHNFWYYAYSASYPVALGVWLVHLWSYRERPVLESALCNLENDYQRAAAATRRRLVAARGHLAKAVRS